MGNFPFGPNPALALQASTGLAGFALVNGTPNIISWTAPADGKMHRVIVPLAVIVTSAETGGAVGISYTDPSGVARTATVNSGGHGAGPWSYDFPQQVAQVIAPGSTFTLQQSSALTVGAATVYAELWGS